jgi:hypothetical protein
MLKHGMVTRWQKLSVIGFMLMAFAWKTAAATLMMGCHMGGMGGLNAASAVSITAMPAPQALAPQAATDPHAQTRPQGDPHHACDESNDGETAPGQGHCSQCAPCSLGAMVNTGHDASPGMKPQAPRVAAQGCADLSAVVLAFDRPPKRSA